VRKNGPIHVQNDYSAFENEYAWTSVADYVWIDQPVYVLPFLFNVFDEDQMATDFVSRAYFLAS
jgi:carboxypeptidase D